MLQYRETVALYRANLELDLFAPGIASDHEAASLRIKTSGLGGGTVRADVQWRAFDGARVVATGATECFDWTKVALPQGTTHVDVTARSDRSEQRLVIGGLGSIPRAPVQVRTDNWERATQGVRQTRTLRAEAWAWSGFGIFVVVLCLTGEMAAWIVRLLFRARAGWQSLAAAIAVAALGAHWWCLPRIWTDGARTTPGYLEQLFDGIRYGVWLLLHR